MESAIDPAALFKCEICGLNNFSQKLYDDHQNFHNGIKPYSCPLCVYSAYSQLTLCYHTKHCHNTTPTLAAAQARQMERDGV